MNQNDAGMVEETTTLRPEVESEKCRLRVSSATVAARSARGGQEVAVNVRPRSLAPQMQPTPTTPQSEEAAAAGVAEKAGACEAAALAAARGLPKRSARRRPREEERHQQQSNLSGNSGGGSGSAWKFRRQLPGAVVSAASGGGLVEQLRSRPAPLVGIGAWSGEAGRRVWSWAPWWPGFYDRSGLVSHRPVWPPQFRLGTAAGWHGLHAASRTPSRADICSQIQHRHCRYLHRRSARGSTRAAHRRRRGRSPAAFRHDLTRATRAHLAAERMAPARGAPFRAGL
ncbi:MAG: hypothetical protein ACLTDR_08850 [Adlercreutzia equolifaciens]